MTAAELEAAVKQVETKRTDVERQRAKAIATRAEFGLFQQAAGEAAAAAITLSSPGTTPTFPWSSLATGSTRLPETSSG